MSKISSSCLHFGASQDLGKLTSSPIFLHIFLLPRSRLPQLWGLENTTESRCWQTGVDQRLFLITYCIGSARSTPTHSIGDTYRAHYSPAASTHSPIRQQHTPSDVPFVLPMTFVLQLTAYIYHLMIWPDICWQFMVQTRQPQRSHELLLNLVAATFSKVYQGIPQYPDIIILISSCEYGVILRTRKVFNICSSLSVSELNLLHSLGAHPR